MLPLPCSISGVLGGLVGGLVGQIQGIINGVIGTVKNMLNTVANFLGGIGGMINNLLAMPSKLLAGIQGAIDNLIKKAKDIIIQQINCVSNLVSDFMNAPAALAQGFEANVQGLWDSVTGIGDKLADLAYGAQAMGKTLLDSAFNIQKTLDQVFQGTIGSVASAFNSTIGGAIKSVSGVSKIVNAGIGLMVKAAVVNTAVNVVKKAIA